MTEDKRGNVRGACRDEDCDCSLYERDDSTPGLRCAYCDHPPARHLAMRIVDSTEVPHANINGKEFMVLDPLAIVLPKDDSPPKTLGCAVLTTSPYSDDLEKNSAAPDNGRLMNTSKSQSSNSDSTYVPSSAESQSSPSSDGDVSPPKIRRREVPVSDLTGGTAKEGSTVATPVKPNPEAPKKQRRVLKNSSSKEKLVLNKEEIIACVPETLPPAIAAALDPDQPGDFTTSHRCTLVRDLASRLNAKGFKLKAEVDIATAEAVQRWGSPVKSQFGNENAALTKSVMERIAKINRPQFGLGSSKSKPACKSSASAESSHNMEAHDEAAASMNEEMRKVRPSLPILRSLLLITRKVRRENILATPTTVTKILKLYPALKIQDLLLAEFEAIVEITLPEIEAAWEETTKKLRRFCEGDRFLDTYVDKSLPEDCQHVLLLEILPDIVKGGKKSSQRRRRVIEVFEPGTAIEATTPDPEDPPRIIAIGNSSEPNLSLTIYADGQPLAVTKNPIRAVTLLLAAYWVFDVSFPVDAKPSLLFLSAAALGKKAPAEVVKYTTVTNLLNKLRLLK